jgi:hypothetical protein
MWPWIRHWRDWAMHDLWNLTRSGPQPKTLHYSFEKAGLILHDQPVPWNAEAVVVEALVYLPDNLAGPKSEFRLRIPGREPILPESFRCHENEKTRLQFRFPPPPHSVALEIVWRDRRLGSLTLPVLTQDDFLSNLRLQLPTLFVRIGEQNVACQTFVANQCRGLVASTMVTSPTSLVPLLDLGLRLEFRSDKGGIQATSAQLSSSQLADRQALVAVVPKRIPKRIGSWTAVWLVGDRPLICQRVRAIGQGAFHRSLRVSDSRFVLQMADGEIKVSRHLPPLDDVARAGPCFLVSSKEPGMAGFCTLQTRAQVLGSHAPQLQEQEILITDGPAVVAPGTVAARDLERVSAFELKLKRESLGVLPMTPVPPATFTSEGGFKEPAEFTWSVSADEELNDRLARLINGGKHDS